MQITAKITRLAAIIALCTAWACASEPKKQLIGRPMEETREQKDRRMKWWREARFGMFIHWGLYAIPAGEWNGQTNYGEWIRNEAKIPLAEYEKLQARFNPTAFDARAWARMAKDAGMKYLVITSKHHDGFCLFDTKQTTWSVMHTPFGRDIIRELSNACREEGIVFCCYHSIMDWHHPDYLPRREWEETTRPVGDADYDRFNGYLLSQVRELMTNYGGLGVLWFDGEWEKTWTHERGVSLYRYCRGLYPDLIINNRVDTGREGMEGFSKHEGRVGDFHTPEQTVPAHGLPGQDWESCVTMNNHWGYNSHDKNFKSTRDLIRMLVDIASKGGNFLLNVGPMADGRFPPESVQRLEEIGAWMKVNGESVYGTQAGGLPSLAWGRCTARRSGDTTSTVYLHVFDWPADGQLKVPVNQAPAKAFLLSDRNAMLPVEKAGDGIVIRVPAASPNADVSVIALEGWK